MNCYTIGCENEAEHENNLLGGNPAGDVAFCNQCDPFGDLAHEGSAQEVQERIINGP